MFTTVNGIFAYVPTYKAYHRQLLEELYEDNVMYLEMRSGISPVRLIFFVALMLVKRFLIQRLLMRTGDELAAMK